jgi:hypothetical protein
LTPRMVSTASTVRSPDDAFRLKFQAIARRKT